MTDISDFILFFGKTLQPDDKKEGLLQVQRLSFLRRKCPLSPTLRGNSFSARRYIPPNELCPALVSGLTVQPCGELRCSGTRFDFFDCGSYLNRKEIIPLSVPESMPVDGTMKCLGGSDFESAGREQNKKWFKQNKEQVDTFFC